MPYIPKKYRPKFDAWIKTAPPILTTGELNYVLTKTVLKWLKTCSCSGEPHYEDFNRALNAMEAAKLEFYRRMVAPYEDQKCKENGDVYS